MPNGEKKGEDGLDEARAKNEIIEVETDNASLHPFYTVIQTPGGANTLRIVNESPIEFPLMANVRPFDTVSDEKAEFNYGGPYF